MVCEGTLVCAQLRSVILIKELAWGADMIGSQMIIQSFTQLPAFLLHSTRLSRLDKDVGARYMGNILLWHSPPSLTYVYSNMREFHGPDFQIRHTYFNFKTCDRILCSKSNIKYMNYSDFTFL